MDTTLLVVLWIVGTLVATTFSVVLGRRYGVEYPMAFMATLVIAAAVMANKLVVFGPFAVPAGVIVASATYLMTDMFSEFWGRQIASRAVWVGFLGLLGFILALQTAVYWPSPVFVQEHADAFNALLGPTPRIALASVVAYLFSQHHDVWAYHFWKNFSNGRHLWLRNNASTIVSQLIDSVIFLTIAFYGVMPIGEMIIDMWCVKVIIALLDTPFIYLGRWIVTALERPAPQATRDNVELAMSVV
ncbi:MAG: queuosine precursor transporter [Chlamydiales bacterium]|nr:queuosine precursor transporter [Chlamydiales bacterium]